MDIIAAESDGVQQETLNIMNIINEMEDFEFIDGEISPFDFAFPIGNYGRYCGKGNKGGTPINDLDRACQAHDGCFLGFSNTSTKNKQCNARFVTALLPIVQANSEFTIKGAYARAALYLFSRFI